MTQVTVNGNTYSDDGTAAKDMLNGGHRTHFFPLVSDNVAVVGQSAASAAAAAVSAAQAAAVSGSQQGTSTTSVLVGAGSKTWTTQTGKQFVVGSFITVARTSDPNTLMHGVCTAYNSGSGSLTINVATVQGAGTFTDWSMNIAGAAGPTGASGNGSVAYLALTAGYTALATDRGKLIDCTSGTFTLAFQAAATLGANWATTVRNSGTGTITLDPNAAELIDGAATYVLHAGSTVSLTCDGSTLRTYDRDLNRLARLPILQANPGWTPASAMEPLGAVTAFTNLAQCEYLSHGSGVYVASGSTAAANVASSPDAAAWTLRAMPSSAVWITGSDGTAFLGIVAGATTTATSAAGITWAAATALPASIAAPYQPVKVGGLWIVAGPQTTYYTSTDGVAWTTRTFPAAPTAAVLVLGTTAWVRTATTTAYTSTDGITWTVRTLPANYAAGSPSVQSDGSIAALVNASAGWERTTDAITWSATGTPPANGFSGTYATLNGIRLHGNATEQLTCDSGGWVRRYDVFGLTLAGGNVSIYGCRNRGVLSGRFLSADPAGGYVGVIAPNLTTVLGLFA